MPHFHRVQGFWRPLLGERCRLRGSKRRQKLSVLMACDTHIGGALRLLGTVALAAVLWAPQVAAAQQTPEGENHRAAPNAPGSAAAPDVPAGGETATEGSATISGTVMDTNGAEVEDAHVVLNCLTGAQIRSGQSGSNGEFEFTGLPPGRFKLVISGRGWGTFASAEIQLHAGDFYIVPKVVLRMTASTSVRVFANREELAEEQVHIAEQQRVVGVFPNFYSSYDWNAPPLLPKQKFQLALRSLTDPMAFVGVAAAAGIEQEAGAFSGYGSGAQGYAKRFGAAYTSDFTARMLAHAVFPSLFHQDPRYFYKGTGSFRSRALYAISAAVIARGDNGRWEPNYSYVLGIFAASGLSNLYYPPQNRGALLTFTNGLADVADDAAGNLLREFVLKRFTSRARRAGARQP